MSIGGIYSFLAFVLCLLDVRTVRGLKHTEAVRSADLQPEPFVDIPGYHVLRTEIWEDEDVVYIAKRGGGSGEDCQSDCPTYSPWEWTTEEQEELKEEGSEATDSDSDSDGSEAGFKLKPRSTAVNGTHSHILVKRGDPKEANICDKTIMGLDENEEPIFSSHIFIKSLGYPNPGQIEKRFNLVYDFADPLSPDEISWFEFKNIGKRITELDQDNQPRTYGVEHILEWHLIKEFLEEDQEAKKENSRCALMHNFFNIPVSINTKLTAKKIKKSYKVQDETYTFDVNKQQKALDYVIEQIPGGPKNSKWHYEFMVLQSDINGSKKQLWSRKSKSMTSKPEYGSDGVTLKRIKKNNPTMEFEIENKYYDPNVPEDQSYFEDNRGYIRALTKFRTVFGVYKYGQEKLVQEYFMAQVNRIGEAFRYLEEDVLPNQNYPEDILPKGTKYQSQGLRDQWISFMQDGFKEGKDKIEKWMEKFAPKIRELAEAEGSGLRARGGTSKKTCATGTNDEVSHRAKLLMQLYDDEEYRGVWKYPWKEDENTETTETSS